MRKQRFGEQQVLGFVNEADCLRGLEAENTELKRFLAEAHLDVEPLKVPFNVKR
jgi:hypothetical protein